MLDVNNLFHATRIVEGYGVIETTGQECKNLGFQKVLVITDPFLASSEHYEKLCFAQCLKIQELYFQKNSYRVNHRKKKLR